MIRRFTTAGGSVYDVIWDDGITPTRGPRYGRIRKNGHEWQACAIITFLWMEPGDNIAFLTGEDFDDLTRTSPIASVEELREKP